MPRRRGRPRKKNMKDKILKIVLTVVIILVIAVAALYGYLIFTR